MNRHIAIDIGSESGRAIVGYLKDEKLYSEEIHRFRTQFMQVRNRGMRNFYRYHEEILHSLSVYREKYGPKLSSIGVDAWGMDFVILDRGGNVLKMPAFYREATRTSDVNDIIEKKFGIRRLYERNGNQALPSDTLNQLIRLKRDDDPCLDNPHGLLFVSDLFHYFLGAMPCNEYSLASYGRLYNVLTQEWDAEVFNAFGFPMTLCKPVVHAGDTIGTVDPAILAGAGLEGEVPIITPCGHDTASAAMAIPDTGDDWAFISSGTWSLMGFETPGPIINELAIEYNLSNDGLAMGVNLFKKNITGTWLIQQCKDVWGKYSYDQLTDLAEAAKDEDLFIDVNADDFYMPKNMPEAIARAVARDFGCEVDPSDAGRIARIIFQSMALKYRYYLDILLRAADKTISKMYITGGGSRNRVINQCTANAIGNPVYTGVYEGTSVGNLLLQAYGSGEIKDKQELRQIVKNSFPQNEFLPADKAKWDEKYAIFMEKAARPNEW